MKKHDTIATRLSLILCKLNAGERFTVESLSKEFGVDIRTIQRDLNQRLLYLPIKKENKHYYLESYYLGKLNFTDIKNFAMLSGICELYPTFDETFLQRMLDHTVNDAYLIKGHNYEDLSKSKEIFALLEETIISQKQITFTYKEKARQVAPYKMLNIKGIWYLAGVEDNKLKSFTVSKIEQLSSSEVNFELDDEITKRVADPKNLWFGSQKELILKVSKEVAQYFTRRDIIPNQSIIKTLETGALLVSTMVSYDEEILKIVRYWIPHVTIVSPMVLQEKLESGLRGYMGLES